MATSAQLLTVLQNAKDALQSIQNDVKMYHDSYVANDAKINSCTYQPANMYGSSPSYNCTFDNQNHTVIEYNNWVNARKNDKLGEDTASAKISGAQAKVDSAQKAYDAQVALESKAGNSTGSSNAGTKKPMNPKTKAILYAVVIGAIVLTLFIVWYKNKNK